MYNFFKEDGMRSIIYTGKYLFLKICFIVLVSMFLSVSANAADKENSYEDPDFPWESMVLPERDLLYYPDEAIKLMKLKTGDVVADVGPGPGYWTFHLAQAVGKEGKVYAIDIDADYYPDLNNYFARRIANTGENPYANVRMMRSLEDDIGMPSNTLDAVFLCQMGILLAEAEDVESESFNEYSQKVTMMRISRRLVKSIYRALKPGGKLIVIDMFDSEIIRKNDFYTRTLGELQPFVAAKDVALVKKNYEDMGFKLKEDHKIYSDKEHAMDVQKFEKLEAYKSMSEKVKMFYANEMFFLVFEKPEDKTTQPGIVISSDKETYRVGDAIKIKADYRNLPEDGERFWLKDSPLDAGERQKTGRVFSISVIPEITHEDGIPVNQIYFAEETEGKKFFAEPVGTQPEWKIQKRTWEDPRTGKMLYDGAGFTAVTSPSGATLYCFDTIPGKYKLIIARRTMTSIEGGEPIIEIVRSNPITIEILP
jgi:predicted methyltransferase